MRNFSLTFFAPALAISQDLPSGGPYVMQDRRLKGGGDVFTAYINNTIRVGWIGEGYE